MDDKPYSMWIVIKRLILLLKPYNLWVTIRITGTVAFTAINILIAHFIGDLIDAAVWGQYQDVLNIIYLLFPVIIAGVIINYIINYISGRYTAYALRDFRMQMVRHIDNLPVSDMEAHHSGDTVSRLTNDISVVQGFFENTLPNLIFQPLIFITAFIYMLFINWSLLLLSIILMPGAMLLTGMVSKPIEKYTHQLQEMLGKINSVAQDAIGGMYILKAFNIKGILYNKYKAEVDNSVIKGIEVEKRNSFMIPIVNVLRIVPFVICLSYGGYLSVRGQMSAGSLIAFVQLLNFIVNPVTVMPDTISSLRVTTGAASRLFELLDKPAERTDGRSFDMDSNAIPAEFIDVSFSYDGQTKILNRLNLKLQAGKTIALVGHSGCGKSTLLKLMCGFYEQQEGHVKLYGDDLSAWKLSDVRKKFSLVSQDTYLFPATISENIAYGRPEAAKDEIINAAKAANAHDFIMGLPDGYDTMTGERGTRLSGGQRQRIAIARAILKDAPVLLLDEPTSALDIESEILAQEALKHIMEKRTVLIIAHRLSSVREADEVLVLDQGCIMENGTHEQLIKKDGIYKQLYLKQFKTQECFHMEAAGKGDAINA